MHRAAPLHALVRHLRPGSYGHAVFKLQSEELCDFDEVFLASFNQSWSSALRLPTWRDVLRLQYTTAHQEELEPTLLAISTVCERISSGATREGTVSIPFVRGTDGTEARILTQIQKKNSLKSTVSTNAYER